MVSPEFYDMYISNLLEKGIAPNGDVTPGLPSKESQELLKRLKKLNKQPEKKNCT